MFPGGNLLNLALTVINRQAFQYQQLLSITTNELGLDIQNFSSPIPLSGSIQPVERSQVKELGLDFNKRVIEIWVEENLKDVARNSAGDRILYNNRIWQVIGEDEWFELDKWDQILAVEVVEN